MNSPVDTKVAFDWQGHRGCRGLLPENTIEGFLHALSFKGIVTLEMDLAVSKDGYLVVSHEPWMSPEICTHPNGKPVYLPDNEADYIALYKLDYADIIKFDCGSRGHERFPNQQPMPTYKPLLDDVFEAVKTYCTQNNRKIPHFNIEIKSKYEYDTLFTPPVKDFVQLVYQSIQKHFPTNYVEIITLQSFDIRALEAFWELDQQIRIAYLVENTNDFQSNMSILSFIPRIYSPHHSLVNKNLLTTCKELNMKVIPWTVNDVETMNALIKMGVDGIITDYPNLIELCEILK